MLFFFPLIFGFYLNYLSIPVVRKRAEKRISNPYSPLPDMIHDLIPPIPFLSPDYFICFSLFLSLLYKLNNIEKNVLCMGICSIIRSLFIMLTIMPTCSPKKTEIESSSLYDVYVLSTHDLMFSGHSIIFIGIGNIINSKIVIILGPLLSVCSRQHYTIDVCVSGLMYYTVYTLLDL